MKTEQLCKIIDSQFCLTMLNKIGVLMFLTVLLSGCGGGDADDKTSTTEPALVQKSTSLISNTAPSGATFANYKSTTVSFDPSGLSFIGNRLFLKLNHHDGNVIYLGEINRFELFSIDIEVKQNISQINYETFTTDENDDTIFGVIQL